MKRDTYLANQNDKRNGHSDNKLWAKYNNKLSKLVHNNTGVFQGSPLSAQLFIIYADYVMNEYKNISC